VPHSDLIRNIGSYYEPIVWAKVRTSENPSSENISDREFLELMESDTLPLLIVLQPINREWESWSYMSKLSFLEQRI
jgi:hypothetical protein